MIRGLSPTKHEMAILRRAAASYIFFTFNAERGRPLYCYGDGETVRNEFNEPITAEEFTKLQRLLVPSKQDNLLGADGPPQRWDVMRP